MPPCEFVAFFHNGKRNITVATEHFMKRNAIAINHMGIEKNWETKKIKMLYNVLKG